MMALVSNSVVSLQEAVIAGILQGILEWLPLSSEGNMVIYLSGFLGLDSAETLGFAVFLHIGTGIAALVYFRYEVASLIRMQNKEHKMLLHKLAIITLVTGMVGLPIFFLLSLPHFIGETLLCITGVALIITGFMQRNLGGQGLKDYKNLNWIETLGLGIVQGLSIIPGLSRSGVTTSLLLFKNYQVKEAFRLSFLMSIPASFAAGLGMILINNYAITSHHLISLFSTIVVGYLSIDLLLKVAEKTSFWKICIIMGGIALLAFLTSLFSVNA